MHLCRCLSAWQRQAWKINMNRKMQAILFTQPTHSHFCPYSFEEVLLYLSLFQVTLNWCHILLWKDKEKDFIHIKEDTIDKYCAEFRICNKKMWIGSYRTSRRGAFILDCISRHWAKLLRTMFFWRHKIKHTMHAFYGLHVTHLGEMKRQSKE